MGDEQRSVVPEDHQDLLGQVDLDVGGGAVGPAGAATPSGSCIRSHMAGVTCPVTLSAGVPRTSFSKAQTAWIVDGP